MATYGESLTIKEQEFDIYLSESLGTENALYDYPLNEAGLFIRPSEVPPGWKTFPIIKAALRWEKKNGWLYSE